MAKKIKDNRKRSKILGVGKDKQELAVIHFKLVKCFPNFQDRLNYIKAICEDLEKPEDPRLVEGHFPELDKQKVA